jgi:hypothetical protein
MYGVLGGRSKGGSSEEQSLARASDQCNRLMRQIEASIEHAEVARSERFGARLGPEDPIQGVPKPAEGLWSKAHAEHRARVEENLLRPPAPRPAGEAPSSAPETNKVYHQRSSASG